MVKIGNMKDGIPVCSSNTNFSRLQSFRRGKTTVVSFDPSAKKINIKEPIIVTSEIDWPLKGAEIVESMRILAHDADIFKKIVKSGENRVVADLIYLDLLKTKAYFVFKRDLGDLKIFYDAEKKESMFGSTISSPTSIGSLKGYFVNTAQENLFGFLQTDIKIPEGVPLELKTIGCTINPRNERKMHLFNLVAISEARENSNLALKEKLPLRGIMTGFNKPVDPNGLMISYMGIDLFMPLAESPNRIPGVKPKEKAFELSLKFFGEKIIFYPAFSNINHEMIAVSKKPKKYQRSAPPNF